MVVKYTLPNNCLKPSIILYKITLKFALMINREDSYKNKGARKKLLELLRQKGITDDNVLKAMDNIQRHLFFNKTFESHAYEDKAFPIGEGQTISQPYTVAYQTQLLQIDKGDKVLEIGTGSGYQTCVLAHLGASVYSIERHAALSDKAKTMLAHFNLKAILMCGDGTKGWPQHAPFNKIIVTAGAPVVPKQLAAQLAIGGLMVIPVGNEKEQQMMTIVRKTEKTFEKIILETFRFVPLIGENGWK
jgi:protein-L-isoaspartate(D-aspartate) O-methyltransferase